MRYLNTFYAKSPPHSLRSALIGLLILISPLWGLVLAIRAFDAVISMHPVSTRDAAGFSEKKFARVKAGMTANAVQQILGKPLQISDKSDDTEEWWYTGPKEPVNGW